jgi:hypothetical protein
LPQHPVVRPAALLSQRPPLPRADPVVPGSAVVVGLAGLSSGRGRLHNLPF